jgi:hypothetical protein
MLEGWPDSSVASPSYTGGGVLLYVSVELILHE